MERSEPYRILGLDSDAGYEEIKCAYRYLSKKYHPDRSGRPDTGLRFMRVVKAYKSLKVHARFDCPVPPSEVQEDLFALGAKALGSADPGVRARAVRRLGFTGKKAACVFLRRCLSDADEKVCAAAVRAIADLSAYQASGEVAALWARSSSGLRRAILDTAEATGEPLFRPALQLAASEGGLDALRARRILSESLEQSV